MRGGAGEEEGKAAAIAAAITAAIAAAIDAAIVVAIVLTPGVPGLDISQSSDYSSESSSESFPGSVVDDTNVPLLSCPQRQRQRVGKGGGG